VLPQAPLLGTRQRCRSALDRRIAVRAQRPLGAWLSKRRAHIPKVVL